MTCVPSALGVRAGLTLLALALASCTLMGHEKVAGWPRLDIVEHYLPEAQMRDKCAQYIGFGMSPQACAEFDLARQRCHLWFSADFPPTRAMVEHERLHCRGYDHVGMGTMASMLSRYHGNASAGR